MILTWKDMVTTVLAVFVVGFYYMVSKAGTAPILFGNRGAILVLGIMGIVMCAFSGASNTQGQTVWSILASVLGVGALLFILYGLISGAKLAVIGLSIIILALWVITTLHHVIGR